MKKPLLFDMNEREWNYVNDDYRTMCFQGSPNVTYVLTEAHRPVKGEAEKVVCKIPGEKNVYIYRGECNYVVDGVPYHLDEGCYMTIPKNVEHYIDFCSTATVYELAIIEPKLPDMPESPKISSRNHGNWDE